MNRRRDRAAEGGFSLVEVCVSSLVLVVAIAGLVVTTVYSRNLSESSRHLWHATNAASATLEEIRHQSVTKWSDVTNWNGVHCDYGIGDPIDPYAAKLAAEVSSDDTVLDRSTGMWTAGATAPNFYFVEVHAASTSDEFANSLDFQTYVADRAGLKNLSDQSTTTDAGGGATGSVNAAASYITTTPTNVALASAKGDFKLSYNLTNSATLPKIVTSASVTGTSAATIGSFKLNGYSLYNNMAKASQTVSLTGIDKILPTGLAPGQVSIALDSPKGTFSGQTVVVKLTFSDASTATISVKP